MQSNQFIHPFWITDGALRLKVIENDRLHVIFQLSDLKDLFPEKQLSHLMFYISSCVHVIDKADVFAYIFTFSFIFKASSFLKQHFLYFFFTFVKMSQPFLTELRDVFRTQSNICDGDIWVK